MTESELAASCANWWTNIVSPGDVVPPAAAPAWRRAVRTMPVVNFGDPRLPERFWASVAPCPTSGCWLWFKAQTAAGYGMTTVATMKIGYAHRFAYEQTVDPIADGLHVDHLCRVRCCVNPLHLEPVTQHENILRGVGFAAVNATKSACPKGHSYTEENTTHVVSKNGPGRMCRQCNRDRSVRAYYKSERRRLAVEKGASRC